jgi:hypothetical protein
MKNIFTVISVMVVLVFCGELGAYEIEGGSVDTEDGVIEVVVDVGDGVHLFAASYPEEINHGGQARLIVVDSRGVAREFSRDFRDKAGAVIKRPLGNTDKVLYLDRTGRIRGGLGLTKTDVAGLAMANPQTFGRASGVEELVGTEISEKMDALRFAARAFGTDAVEDEQLQFFKATVEMVAGRKFAGVVRDIIDCSEANEVVAAAGRDLDEDGISPLARGVYLVSEGDNGGFGKPRSWIEEGDNGGFGKPQSSVEEGDNGGFGMPKSVEEGDNGGFGYEVIVQGFAEIPDAPLLPRTTLNTGGMTIYLF